MNLLENSWVVIEPMSPEQVYKLLVLVRAANIRVDPVLDCKFSYAGLVYLKFMGDLTYVYSADSYGDYIHMSLQELQNLLIEMIKNNTSHD